MTEMAERRPALITLTTDFGDADGFPAAMKGVILGISPSATVADVTHAVPPQNVAHASFVLGAFAPYFPLDSVHVAVVDPGVGTERRALALQSLDGTVFAGPDNGLFSHVMASGGAQEAASHERPFLEPKAAVVPAGWHAHSVENPEYLRPEIAMTFHGRDVFAPAAAHLSAGVAIRALGPEVNEIVRLNLPGPRTTARGLAGHVQYVDRFGNLVTDIPATAGLRQHRNVTISGRVIGRVVGSYFDAGALGCVLGSHGFPEIAVYGGSAAGELGAAVGDEVTVELA